MTRPNKPDSFEVRSEVFTHDLKARNWVNPGDKNYIHYYNEGDHCTIGADTDRGSVRGTNWALVRFETVKLNTMIHSNLCTNYSMKSPTTAASTNQQVVEGENSLGESSSAVDSNTVKEEN